MKNRIIAVGTLLALLASSDVFAWGERGHHVICEAATRLVEEKELKSLLSSRGHLMGHVCNIPDTYWRRLQDEAKKELSALEKEKKNSGGNLETESAELEEARLRFRSLKMQASSHYIEPDLFSLPMETLPLQLSEIFKLPEIKAADDLNLKMGTSWWRANQFFNLTHADAVSAKDWIEKVQFLKALPKLTTKQKKELQALKTQFNERVLSMMVNMGLMGHFVGDASQPHHNVADFNGQLSGHDGIHSYYESDSVNYQSLSLVSEVYRLAKETDEKIFEQTVGISREPMDWSPHSEVVLERMRGLSLLSAFEATQVAAIDEKEIITDKTTKTFMFGYKRVHPAIGAQKFHDLIVPQLARSAKLLALFWDEAYRAAGSPKLSGYRSYEYPFTPADVPLDYALAPETYKK